MSDNLREALLDELDKPGTITKARLRNILIDMPATNPDESARELLAQGWDEGANHAWAESGEGWNGEYPNPEITYTSEPTSINPYRQPINLPGDTK